MSPNVLMTHVVPVDRGQSVWNATSRIADGGTRGSVEIVSNYVSDGESIVRDPQARRIYVCLTPRAMQSRQSFKLTHGREPHAIVPDYLK